MTVAEFTRWERLHSQQAFLVGLIKSEKAFAAEKQIERSDLAHLNRVFYGAYVDQSDDVLKAALEEYYIADISYLDSMRKTFPGSSADE